MSVLSRNIVCMSMYEHALMHEGDMNSHGLNSNVPHALHMPACTFVLYILEEDLLRSNIMCLASHSLPPTWDKRHTPLFVFFIHGVEVTPRNFYSKLYQEGSKDFPTC